MAPARSLAFVAIAMLCIAPSAFARNRRTGVSDQRDFARARIAAQSDNYCGTQRRSARAKREFRKKFACPSSGKHGGACPGWVIDHIVALKRCGKDVQDNLAWQTSEEAKWKDRWE